MESRGDFRYNLILCSCFCVIIFARFFVPWLAHAFVSFLVGMVGVGIGRFTIEPMSR
jgi:hypothetical protein